MRLQAGVGVIDITPTGRMALSGFASRTERSVGVHDRLTVRALAVETTVLVTVDVVGLHEDLCARVQQACRPWAQHVVVHATHTHGAPVSMPGRLGDGFDADWVEQVESACVRAVEQAASSQEPVELQSGYGADPAIAQNRRYADGPVDDCLPVLTLRRADGSPLAVLTSYACHPVVLGADNHQITADFPGTARDEIERLTGATAFFATGCAGDANTGHSADPTIASLPSARRTFDEAARVGVLIAENALGAELTLGRGAAAWGFGTETLDLDVPTHEQLLTEAVEWSNRARNAEPATAALFECWAQWARSKSEGADDTWEAPVSVLRWGPVLIIALPGEPFASMATQIRQKLQTPDNVVFVLGYSNGSPGYLPTTEEYVLGGYEVCDAHRYYGMPGPFRKGSAERLVRTALAVAARAEAH